MSKTTFAQSASIGMNTQIMHRVFGRQAHRALDAGAKRLLELERKWSRFISDSEISRINASAGMKSERISYETFDLLSQAKNYSEYSQGLFDVTICPLVDLWNYKQAECAPDGAQIARALQLVNYKDIILNTADRTARLKHKNQSIDLGGIGKGFACDQIISVFKGYGVTSAVTNIGGNVAVIGTKPDGTAWRVGIRHPRGENDLIGMVSVIDKSVVTAGDDQRYFIADNGKRYHHILDTTTGYPSESDLFSVTVITESSAAADALSTTLFIAGIKNGITILKHFPGAEAIFVATNNKVYITSGLNGIFQANVNIQLSIIDEIGFIK